MILLSGIRLRPDYGTYEFDPEYVPQNPLCMKCGLEATPENPVGITIRKGWHFGATGKFLDAICASCREKMSGGH
jgi:hypothetical protein